MAATPSHRLRLRAYLWPHRGALVALAFALVVATALPLAGPQLLRRFVDDAMAGAGLARLIAIAAAYLAVALAGQATNVALTYATGRLAWRTTNRLREDLAEHVLGLDLSFHLHRTPGEFIERIDGDVAALAAFLSRFLLQVVGSVLLLIGAVVLVWREHAMIGAALVGFLAFSALVISRLQSRTVTTAKANREAQARLMGGMEEHLAAVDDLRALAAGPHAMRRFHEQTAGAYRADVRWSIVSGAVLSATNVVFTLGMALLLTLGVLLLQRGTLTVGTVLLLFQYVNLVRRPLESIVGQFKEFQEAAAGVARVRDLMTVEPTLVERVDTQPLSDGPLGVRLDGITFAYGDDPPVLHDVTLSIEPGRSLGLVGHTGSGKTTIARLLTRLYDPTEGMVEVGGIDLRAVPFSSLRQRVRIVTQDVQLFASDVRDNLTLFAPGDDAALLDVLDRVGLGPWVRSLPAGLDTALGPGGVGMSAGEAQLLAFARAFLADPGLLVLDEASSRLDPGTEALIENAIDRLLEGRTAVVIAHRFSSLERVDDIVVLDHGRVVEYGARVDLAADATTRFGRLLALSRGLPA